LIKTKNLCKIYKNGFKAIDNLNLDVSTGDIYGFLGPNGAGKTTTIRMLTGILEPSSGEITINDFDFLQNKMEIKKIIGVLPDSHGFYNWMTGKEYLTYFASLYTDDIGKKQQHISYLLNKVSLSDKANVKIGQYSRGMKQRLGLAKTLINDPKIIFLDEPTLGLDPMGQKDIHDLILELNKTMNMTIFITSHLLKDVEVICNKFAIVRKGKLIEEGRTKELQDKYTEELIIKIKTSDNNLAFQSVRDVDECLDCCINDEYLQFKFQCQLKESIEDIKQNIIQILIEKKISISEIKNVEISIEDVFHKIVSDDTEGRN
jgi:ABC-2 type transport system ATP-binding protein